MNEHPVFAVVGHPNKGKSSIVATLAQDETVAISPEPGTTTICRRYPMQVDGRQLYTLVDTPGFQRARQAIDWMKQHETTADKHIDVVRQFVQWHRARNLMQEECELLDPILAGAGILYVVDGSIPYGPEYESEMEILRWTGRPSMALINPIGRADHTGEWRNALDQYFKIVRVFNAITAEHHKRVELLHAFGQLNEPWRQPLEEAAALLNEERDRRRKQSARAITEMLIDLVGMKQTRSVDAEENTKPYEPELIEKYKNHLRERERRCRQQIESIYAHRGLDRRESAFDLLESDLFANATWRLWGLRKHQLLLGGAAGGAAIGGLVDSAVGGTSLLAGSALGAVVGAAAAWWSTHQLAKVELLGRTMGRKVLQVGPMRNPNLMFVALNRARYHHMLIAERTHAQRDALQLDSHESQVDDLARSIDSAARSKLLHFYRNIRNSDDLIYDHDNLVTVIEMIIQNDLKTMTTGQT